MLDHSLNRLRKTLGLSDLPDVIDIPSGLDRIATTRPLEEATIDDVVFAIQALKQQYSSLCRRIDALQNLHDLAQQEGALGAALAVTALTQNEELL
jgi:hypothetical protein